VDQLVQIVKDRAGISEQQARTAVTVVVGELKKRLPDPIAGQIDGFLNGKGDPKNNQDPLGGLGDMLGR
jgi:hypothetical protein